MKTPPLALGAAVAGALLCTSAFGSDVGKRFPSEMRTLVDKVTGVPINVLTTGPADDRKIYQTHPQWTADGNYIIFRSTGRAVAAGPQIFAIHETTGEMIQLTDGPNSNASMICIARKSMKIYFLRYSGNAAAAPGMPERPLAQTPAEAQARGGFAARGIAQMIELDLEKLFADSAAGKVQSPSAYERVCGTLPAGMRDSGGFGLDADEQFAYIGVAGGDTGNHLPPGTEIMKTAEGQRMGAGPAGIRSMNLATGELKVVIDTPFNMGHVQTNPWVPGEIVYCHETGGDAPQRMWAVMADGSNNRPLYVENPGDWITHEAVITKDEVVFNMIGHQPRLRLHPTGIAVINLRNNQMKIWGQVEDSPPGGRSTGGYWHSNGSADGRWLVGDTFAGNVWLIDRRNGAQTLLTTGHRMQPDHAHPTFSADSKRILIESGLLSDGRSLDLMVVPIPSHVL
jgi:oligogalacturonide lyase